MIELTTINLKYILTIPLKPRMGTYSTYKTILPMEKYFNKEFLFPRFILVEHSVQAEHYDALKKYDTI